MSKHTPTPWFNNSRCLIGPRFETDDQSDGMLDDLLEVYGDNREVNAAFIVKAVNSYDAMRVALLEIEQISDYCVNAEHYTAERALSDLQEIRNTIKRCLVIGGL